MKIASLYAYSIISFLQKYKETLECLCHSIRLLTYEVLVGQDLNAVKYGSYVELKGDVLRVMAVLC